MSVTLKSLTKDLGIGAAGIVLGFAACSLTGCQNATVRGAGSALDMSYPLIRQNAELGLKARSADPGETIGTFLADNAINPITPAEADFMRNTFDEHQETINKLKTFGMTP